MPPVFSLMKSCLQLRSNLGGKTTQEQFSYKLRSLSTALGKKGRNGINDWPGKSKASQLLVSSHLAITAGRKLKKKNKSKQN